LTVLLSVRLRGRGLLLPRRRLLRLRLLPRRRCLNVRGLNVRGLNVRGLSLRGLSLRGLSLRGLSLRGLSLHPSRVPPYLTGLIRVLLGRPARSLRNHRPYRLHGAKRCEPLIGVHVGIGGSRVLRREPGLRPNAFVE
jgi:hypothetical protein